MFVTNCKPVHVPSPPVPGGDQSADDFAVLLGHQEGRRRLGSDELHDIIEAIGRARMLAPGLRPQLQDGRHLALETSTYVEFLAGQARSIRRRRRGQSAPELAASIQLENSQARCH